MYIIIFYDAMLCCLIGRCQHLRQKFLHARSVRVKYTEKVVTNIETDGQDRGYKNDIGSQWP
jgi:hypothetical protein